MNDVLEFSHQKVSEIVLGNPNAMAVFTKYGIDFCCGGKLDLSTACAKKKINIHDVEQDLLAAFASSKSEPLAEEQQTWDLDRLAHYIEKTHHAYVQTQTAELFRLLDKVTKRHGDDHPELHEVFAAFKVVSSELAGHMKKEELILFPWIKRLAAVQRGEIAYEKPPFGSVANPIRMMEMDHEGAGSGMNSIRLFANNYVLPEGACMSYWQTYQYLEAFEKDLHIHVHLENNILFPKAIALESIVSKSK